MAGATQIRGSTQIIDGTINLAKLESPFLTNAGGDWDITNGNNDATITGLQDPVNPQDAATKNYVDTLLNGIHWKEPVRVASVGSNVVIATDLENGDALDTITLATGDRVLLKDQTVGSEDGVYIVQATGAALRAPDWPVGASAANYATFVEEGAVNADTAWVVTNDDPTDVIGTDDLVLVKFANTSAAVTDVCNETPTVTNGSPTVTLANTNLVTNCERIYLNGLRQNSPADYSIVYATGVITFTSNLVTGDCVVADYKIP